MLGEHINDYRCKSAAGRFDELDWDPSVDVSQIGVIAKDGIVTLAGHVPEYAAKHAAEVAAKRVHGVRAVANEIDVRPPEAAHQQDDEEIAQAAISALKWDARIPDDRLQVAVEDGWITVEGSVLRQQQLQAIDSSSITCRESGG